MAYNTRDGVLTNPKVSELIEALQDQLHVYGDVPVKFYLDGDNLSRSIQADFYKDAFTLSFQSEDEED